MLVQSHYFLLALFSLLSLASAAFIRAVMQKYDWMLITIILLIVVPGVILVIALSIVWARNEAAWRKSAAEQQNGFQNLYEKVIADQQAIFASTVALMRDEHTTAIQAMSEAQRAAWEEATGQWLQAAARRSLEKEEQLLKP